MHVKNMMMITLVMNIAVIIIVVIKGLDLNLFWLQNLFKLLICWFYLSFLYIT